MPDHQVLEAGYLLRPLQHLDLAIFGPQGCEPPGCGQNQFGSRNTPRSRSEIWQGNHGTTAMTVCCETLLWYMLRALDDINANVFGRKVLLQSELTMVGRVCCNDADKFLLIDDLTQ